MPQATFHFPRGFLWGTATAAHQVEGNNTNNNFWDWEQQPGRIVNGDKSALACDWWGGRWREDFDRAAEGGQNAHRFSIEWSRIQPTPDRWDEDALDRYREMLRGLHARGLTPMVTLHHFTEPLWLAEMGGWENEAIVGYFETFVRKAVEALREFCSLWITLNEPNVRAAYGYLFPAFPPGKSDILACFRVMTNMALAHAAAYRVIHALQPTARVGMAVMWRGFIPHKAWFPPDGWVAGLFSSLFNEFFPTAASRGVLRFPFWTKRVPQAKGTQDFLGVNYYTRDRVAFDLFKPGEMFARRFFAAGADLSDTDWIANDPEGLFAALKWGKRFELPMIITENGVEDADDHLRPRYLAQHIHQLWRAVNYNWLIKGYFHWTLVDNFEWDRGWKQRFGLWELDPATQARRKRPSADLYADICRENGLSSEMVQRYAPEVLENIFPR